MMTEDEPFHWDILRSKVLVDMYGENDLDKVLFNHLEDRTAEGENQGVEGIDNYYSFLTCHEGLKILCGLTHHMKNATYANSSKLYNGLYAPTGEYQHGFPSMEARLSRARETSLEYDIPYWYVPSSDYMRNKDDHPTLAGVKRWKSPREIRANVNMALTYGARGIVYIAFYNARQGTDEYGEMSETIFDNEGNLKVGNYDLVNYWKKQDKLPNTMGYYETPITYEELYDELIDINTKLDTVRNVLNTTISLDAFRYDDVPRSLVCDYEGNRDRGEDDDYPPDYEECVDFLDFGTFVCPYTGVRYFAVSDRFCNWPPADFPDPPEEDEVTVRHPGRVIFDIYDDDPDPDYFTYFKIADLDHGDGVSTFEVELDNADGRIFKLDPCLNYNPGFEDDENPYAPPPDWTIHDGEGFIGGFEITDETARKGDWSLKVYELYDGALFKLDNDMELDIGEDVFAGMMYRLSGYIKNSHGSAASAALGVKLEQTVPAIAGTITINGGTEWAGPDGWVYTYADFEMPEPYENPPRDTIWTQIGVADGDENSTLWFDEVSLEPLSRVFNGHFEYDGGDCWPGESPGWGSRLGSPGQNYWRSSPGYYGDYCLKVSAKAEEDNVVRNDEKLYLGKGTNYVVTGWARRGSTIQGVDAEVVVEFYASNGDMFNKKSYVVPTDGDWYRFNVSITPDDWETAIYPIAPNTPPAYVRIACKMEAGSGDAYFDNIELLETNLAPNGSFELAEEGPHWPDRWGYTGVVPQPGPGDPVWSALYDADARYDRRCWRVRTPPNNINYASETFMLEPDTQYRLSGWLRNFDVPGGLPNPAGCKLSITLYDDSGGFEGSYSTDKVSNSEEWTYKYKDFTTPQTEAGYYGRVTVIEEEGAYSSAADGIRVLPTSILE